MKGFFNTMKLAGLTLVLLAVLAFSGSPSAQAADVIAFDMVGSASQNLVSYTNPFTDAWGSGGDGFQKYQRGVSSSIPFSVLDDSLSIFTSDTLGIIKEGNTDVFFGVTDTENGDNSGEVSASWVFDISDASNLSLSIDMGAMGDFESSDYFVWEYAIDGGPAQTAFASTVDEAGSFSYTLEGGAVETLNDPMLVDGVVLFNDLQTFTTALSGSGAQLELTLQASTNGGSEAFVFQNLTIEGTTGPTVVAFDMVDSGDQNLVSYDNPFANAFSSAADGFQKYQRGVSPSIPFSVLDDSLSIFPPDSLGIIKEGNTDVFLGVTDTVNGDNSGEVSATWVFDVAGSSGLSLSIDMGAMGDFESSDYFVWEYQFDGGPVQTAFASTVDEAGSFGYTLEGGAVETLNDPMLVDGVVLFNDLQTFTTALSGSGAQLTLTLRASTNGGSEAFVFQNLIVEAGGTPPPPTGQPLPLTEGFDDCTLSGWEIISVDSDTANTWVCNDIFSTIQANGFGNDAPANEWLITPPLDMDAQENDTLRFRSYTQFSDAGLPYPQVTVQYSSDYAGSGDPTAATWTELTGITFSPENSRQWVDSGVIDLSGISGDTVYFAFQYQASGTGGGSTSLWRLDGINFASFIPVGQCGDPATFMIHDIQGIGDDGADLVLGSTVVVEGVVVGDFQPDDGDHTDLGGFFVQEEDADADGDLLTSEGLFVFAPWATDLNIGDGVRIKGEASDFFGMTQISASDVVACGPSSLPTVTEITLPVASVDDLEAVEGMYVTFPQELAISEFFNFDRFGEIVLTADRQFQPTATFDPGTADSAALADLNARSRITLDDGRTGQNPDPAIHPNGAEFTLVNTFRGGDLVTDATGVINYSFGLYRLQPTVGAEYTAVNDRPAVPDVAGNIEVASFNVLNYFTTIDEGAPICGPSQTLGCRGADTVEEFERQRAKIIAAIAELDADVVGLIEIENHVDDAAVQDLVAGLNDALGAGTYDYIATGPVGTDAIKVAFIYQPATVSAVGDYAVLDTPEFVSPNTPGDPKNRAALAQTFIDDETGGIFTAVVNHLKSKGSSCGEGDDDPEAGSCNLTRALAAQELADWLATDPTGSGDEDFLIIGDLNAYDKEDPIDVFKANGYTDLLFDYQGEFAYSYVFNGQLGYLDYGMANAGLAEEVTGTAAWNINADEPDILDYDTSFKQDAQDALYAPDPFRSSDHDPVLVGLNVCDEIAPTLSVTMTPDTLWSPNHQYVTVSPIIDVADNFDTDVTVTLLSVVSDEPDNGPGDGNTINDIVINDDGTVDVRAERSGRGDGRVYTFTYEAVDDCGNSTIATATVIVPKSQGRGR